MKSKTPRKSNKIRYDVARFVFKYFPEAKLAAAEKEFILQCPWHDGHKKKLYVNASNGVYNCFVCGARGGFLDFVRRVVGAEDRSDVTRLLNVLLSDENADYIDFFDNDGPRVKIAAPSLEYPEEYFPLWMSDLGMEGKAAEEYLFKRGLTKNQISYYKLGFCIGGRYDRRVLIPTFGPGGELVTYVCRDYTGKSPYKVLNPPEVEGNTNKDWVFNLYNACKTRHIVLCEGVFDAIGVGIEGVALFGKSCTDTQLYKIIETKPLRLSILLDPDAQAEANSIALRFLPFIKDVRVCSVPDGYDPGSATKEMIERSLAEYTLPYTGWPDCFGGIYG